MAGAVEALTSAKKVLVVPGYGLAAANAQRPIADLVAALRSKGVDARWVGEWAGGAAGCGRRRAWCSGKGSHAAGMRDLTPPAPATLPLLCRFGIHPVAG